MLHRNIIPVLLLAVSGCAAHKVVVPRDEPWLAPRPEPTLPRALRVKRHVQIKTGYVAAGSGVLGGGTALAGLAIWNGVAGNDLGAEILTFVFSLASVATLLPGAFLLARGLAGDDQEDLRRRRQWLLEHATVELRF